MDLISSGFCDGIYNSACRVAVSGAHVASLHVKLLQSIRAGKGQISVDVSVVVIYPIQ